MLTTYRPIHKFVSNIVEKLYQHVIAPLLDPKFDPDCRNKRWNSAD